MKLSIVTLILSLALLLPQSQAKAYLPLSEQSKNYIALATLGAAVASGTLGYVFKKFFSSDDQERSFPWKWVLIPATIGGVLGGFYSYNNCPETIINGTESFLETMREMPLMKDIVSDTATDAQLKKEFVTSDFKTIALVERLKIMFAKITSGIKKDLLTIKDNHLKPYVDPLLMQITRYEEALKNWIYALNPAYLQELATKNAIESQRLTAQAKMTAANAEWHKALFPNPPATIIINR